MTKLKPTKLIRDGNVAVLYSPGYGAGWSTWNGDNSAFFLFDESLVKLREENASLDDVEKHLKPKFGEDHFCVLGWEDVEISWLPEGTAFVVEEYDGNERIVQHGDAAFHVA